jgi:hypothetical protein
MSTRTIRTALLGQHDPGVLLERWMKRPAISGFRLSSWPVRNSILPEWWFVMQNARRNIFLLLNMIGSQSVSSANRSTGLFSSGVPVVKQMCLMLRVWRYWGSGKRSRTAVGSPLFHPQEGHGRSARVFGSVSP